MFVVRALQVSREKRKTFLFLLLAKENSRDTQLSHRKRKTCGKNKSNVSIGLSGRQRNRKVSFITKALFVT